MMEPAQKQTMCEQLQRIDTSLDYLLLLCLSVALSFGATKIQRKGLCDMLEERATQMPNVQPIRILAGVLVVVALIYFFAESVTGWERSRTLDPCSRHSADLNAWASLFVLGAGVIRLYDVACVQPQKEAQPETPLPD